MLNILRKHKYLFVAILYWLIAGLALLSCVLIEFGKQIGFKYASFYSPLFFYPTIFGGISVYFSLRTILFIFRLSDIQRFGLSRNNMLAFIIVLTALIGFIEFSGNPAIWEVKKSAIENTILMMKPINKQIMNWDVFFNHFDNHPKDPKADTFDTKKEYQSELLRLKTVRKEFNNIIVEASKIKTNWSLTKYFYFVSFVVQSFALFCLFMAITFISIPKFESILVETSGIYTPSLKRHFLLISTSLILGLWWLILRLGFDSDKLSLYGLDLISTSAATPVIGSLYVLSIIYLTLKLRLSYDEKIISTCNMIAGIIATAITFYSTQFGNNILGSNATPQNYAMCTIAIIIVLFPWLFAYKDMLND